MNRIITRHTTNREYFISCKLLSICLLFLALASPPSFATGARGSILTGTVGTMFLASRVLLNARNEPFPDQKAIYLQEQDLSFQESLDFFPEKNVVLKSPATQDNIMTVQWDMPYQLRLCSSSVPRVRELIPEGQEPSMVILQPGQNNHCTTLTAKQEAGIATLSLDSPGPIDPNQSFISVINSDYNSRTKEHALGVSYCLNSKKVLSPEAPPVQKNSVFCADYSPATSDDDSIPNLATFTGETSVHSDFQSLTRTPLQQLLREIEWELYLEDKRFWWHNVMGRILSDDPVKAEQPTTTVAELAGLYGGYTTGHSHQWQQRILTLEPRIGIDPKPSPEYGPSLEHPFDDQYLEQVQGILFWGPKRKPGGVPLPNAPLQPAVYTEVRRKPAIDNARANQAAIDSRNAEAAKSLAKLTADHLTKIADFPWMRLHRYVSTWVPSTEFLTLTNGHDNEKIFNRLKGKIVTNDDPKYNRQQLIVYLCDSIKHALGDIKGDEKYDFSSEMQTALRALNDQLRFYTPDEIKPELSSVTVPSVQELIVYAKSITTAGLFRSTQLSQVMLNESAHRLREIFTSILDVQGSPTSVISETINLSSLAGMFPDEYSSGHFLHKLFDGSFIRHAHVVEDQMFQALSQAMYDMWTAGSPEMKQILAEFAIYVSEENFLTTKTIHSSATPVASASSFPQQPVFTAATLNRLEQAPTLLEMSSLSHGSQAVNIISRVSSKWRDIGIILHLSDQLDNIEHKSLLDNHVCLQRVISFSLQNKTLQSWNQFIRLMKMIGHAKIAGEIQSILEAQNRSRQSQPPFAGTHPALLQTPELEQLVALDMPGGNSINLFERIGDYREFAELLLKDGASRADNFAHKHMRDVPTINSQIASAWLNAGGMNGKGATWQELIEALRQLELNQIADAIMKNRTL